MMSELRIIAVQLPYKLIGGHHKDNHKGWTNLIRVDFSMFRIFHSLVYGEYEV
ncbi:hypothetical protein ERAN111884_00540 [Erysipelothrix anatis]